MSIQFKRRRGLVAEINGLTNALWFGVGVLIVIFFLLGNIQTTLDFRTTVAFAFAFLFSFGYLQFIESNFRNCKARFCVAANRPDAFWQKDITLRNIIWVPIGVVAVFAAVIGASSLGNPLGAIVGIAGSGTVMMIILIRFNAVLLPIFIHGIYNSVVVSIQLGVIDTSQLAFLKALETSPVFVPIIGFGGTFDQIANVSTEIIFQFMLVATSEELLKTALVAFFIFSFRGYFTQKGGIKYLAGALSVLIWTVLHTVANQNLLIGG